MKGLMDHLLIAHIYPIIPSKYWDSGVLFSRFEGYEDRLPKEMEVVWQLAELRDCKTEIPENTEKGMKEIAGMGYQPGGHVIKSGCTWVPLPNRIYRKKIDMNAIRESEAYKKATRRDLLIFGHSHSLRLFFVFQEDQLKVEAFAYGINPWH